MTILCLDIGNTTTHFGIVQDGTSSREIRIPTTGLPKQLARTLQNYEDATHLSFCSVVPSLNPSVAEAAEAAGLLLFNLNPDTCPILIDYPNREEIGQDRLANAVAASAHARLPTIIIDMGTATTFDIVTEENGYEGGVIAAGLSLMREYLHEKTALLPEICYQEASYPENAIGKSTQEAMEIGGIIGYEGMIKEIIATISAELFERGLDHPGLLLTGGKAPFLEEAFSEGCRYVPHLTLHGLESACRRGHC